ncbi:hypothetical protein HanPI659440_Chr07g0269271 [Helianthus annuus]|nr:hypothetical protein HanPI659440_Chr07g0269271 [Helianthus annuus]
MQLGFRQFLSSCYASYQSFFVLSILLNVSHILNLEVLRCWIFTLVMVMVILRLMAIRFVMILGQQLSNDGSVLLKISSSLFVRPCTLFSLVEFGVSCC